MFESRLQKKEKDSVGVGEGGEKKDLQMSK